MARANHESGHSTDLLITANDSGGRIAVLLVQERPGSELPLHVHQNEDEFVYVLSGRVTVLIDGERHVASSGTAFFLARGIERRYAVMSDEARLLIAYIPAGLEVFLQKSREYGGEPDIERLIALAARHGVEITGELPITARARSCHS